MAARRLGLVVFGIAFVALFVAVAIAEGVGHPAPGSGDVVIVEGVSGDVGTITEAEFEHSLELIAVQQGQEEPPKPGEEQYEELKKTALQTVLEGVWIQGLAAEWGIEVSDQEIAAELKKVKKENFPSKGDFKKFLKESHYTPADVNERVKLQILSKELQAQLKGKAPQPSHSEVVDYYEAAKATQFTTKPSRDVRLIVNKDSKKATEALEALSQDDSAGNWTKIAKKYSEEPTTKESGGLQRGLQEGLLEEPLNAAIFSAPEKQLEGPIKAPRGYAVFEVEGETAESASPLSVVESQIESTLAQRLEQEYFSGFVGTFNTEWTSRTFCASGYAIERCANFKGSGHSSAAPEACYEAHPKGGLPEACPAPVYQLVPALPGTVTPLEPKGKPLAQRPHPAGGENEGAAEGGLPEGIVPPAE
ncbi:MAG: peptidyl-prolyl cis-trans isomerase [Solirubrobacterales bacterium]